MRSLTFGRVVVHKQMKMKGANIFWSNVPVQIKEINP